MSGPRDQEELPGYDFNAERISMLKDRIKVLEADIRWAVNVLLEEIAAKFEANDTLDIWRSDAAATVRSFKHRAALAPEQDK